MSLLSNIKKRGLKDILSKRIFSYIEAQFQKVFGVWTKQKDQKAYAEQIIYKRAMCPECYQKGECVHCGCNFNDLAISKEAVCSAQRWGKIQDAKNWEEYKSKYLSNVDFGLVKKKVAEKNE